MAFSRKKPVKKPSKAFRKIKAGLDDALATARKPPEQHSEKCLHMHCQAWLVKSGLWSRLLIFHVANERKGGFGAQMHFKRMGVRPGVADYLLFAADRGAAIELKDEDGDQDREQEKFQKQWEAAGNTYILVRTLEEFQNAVGTFSDGYWPWG